MAVAVRFQPKKRRSPLWVFVPMGVAFAILAGIAIFGIVSPYTLKKAPPPPGRHGELVWGDGIFANRAQVKAWLTLHGASYERWVKAHPAALSLIEPRPAHALAARPKPHRVAPTHLPTKLAAPATRKAAVTHAPAKVAAPAAAARRVETVAQSRQSSQGTNVWFAIVFWVAVLAGLGLGGLALGPQRFIGRLGSLSAAREREVRLVAFGAGTALLLGVVIATLLA